jgi:hypothetical protein
VIALFIAGGLVAALQPWKGSLGPIETANLLQERLRTKDHFDCHEPNGIAAPGEPSWTYICLDLSRPSRQGYLVETSGKRITEIQPTG